MFITFYVKRDAHLTTSDTGILCYNILLKITERIFMSLALDLFNPVEYIRGLRGLGVSQDIAEYQAEHIEKALEAVVKEVKRDVKHQDLATNSSIKETELRLLSEIERLRYQTLKFTIWTGVGVVITLGGLIAKGFHWL